MGPNIHNGYLYLYFSDSINVSDKGETRIIALLDLKSAKYFIKRMDMALTWFNMKFNGPVLGVDIWKTDVYEGSNIDFKVKCTFSTSGKEGELLWEVDRGNPYKLVEFRMYRQETEKLYNYCNSNVGFIK